MISIIIIVKSDRGIENTLKKIVKIPIPEKTEILVIDASEGNLNDIKNIFPSARWVYYHNKKSKKITIPEQRNLGLKKAQGDIIVFIDANCVPDKSWLIELTKPISDEAESVVVGSIKYIGGKTIWVVGEERRNSKKYLDEAPTMNMAFKKEIIKKVGFFDEKFNYGSDVDFTWRATDLGYKIRYNKDAIIYHDWGNLQQEIKRAFRYGEARVRLYKKHPGRWKNLFGYDMVTLTYPLYIIFFPLTFLWPYYPLFILIPIIKNIKIQPLKVVCINLIYGFAVLKELFFPNKN
jgi:cellulose synthase/poly-beta-1,6-N-acetylglucosamine synthase-like glycosyltransferase